MSNYTGDLIERVGRTAITTFLMTYLAGVGPLSDNAVLADLANADVLQRAAVAALMATGTLILGLLTKGVGSSDSASVITPKPEPVVSDDDNPWADIW